VSAYSLKHQQSLKVDFLSFPRDFASLLDRCIEENGSYLCQLERSSSSAMAPVTLNIMESNAFRNLSHLSLQYVWSLSRPETLHVQSDWRASCSFTPADDATVRQYLATCLRQLQESSAQLQTAHSALQGDHQRLQQVGY
jgi:hypothetical protein